MVIEVHAHARDDIFTDAPIANFRGGWAVHPFVGKSPLAHFWNHPIPEEAGARLVWARCGQHTAISSSVPMLGQGNARECMRCRSVLRRESRNT